MQKANLFFMVGFLVMAFSCQSHKEKNRAEANKTENDSLAYRDWHSQSNALKTHPEHLDLAITVDFDKKQIRGSATWTIDPDEGTQYAIFDTYSMEIDSV